MNRFLANIVFLHFLLVYAAPFKMAIPNIYLFTWLSGYISLTLTPLTCCNWDEKRDRAIAQGAFFSQQLT